MAWLYLPVSVVLNSESDSPSEPNVTALSVMLNGKVTPRPLSWHGWQRRKWTTRLSGTTLKRSTAERGAALWISSLRAIRVNRSVTQARNSEQTTRDTFFPTSPESLTNPDRDIVSLKTWERIFDLDSEKSSPSWKNYITALRQDYSRRSRWARRMSANGSLFWRSPMSKEPQVNSRRLKGELGHRMYDIQTGRLAQVGLKQQVELWATPSTAMTVGEVNPNLEKRGKKFYNKITGKEVQSALSTEVRNWKTPQGTDGEGGVMELRADANAHLKLRDHAVNWMTPRTHGKASHTQIMTGDDKGRLENQDLIFQSSHQDPMPITNGEMSFLDFLSSLPPSSKRLNPTFCEWLMGFPLGWTNHDTKINLRAWEMQFHQLLQDLLSAYLQSGLG